MPKQPAARAANSTMHAHYNPPCSLYAVIGRRDTPHPRVPLQDPRAPGARGSPARAAHAAVDLQAAGAAAAAA